MKGAVIYRSAGNFPAAKLMIDKFSSSDIFIKYAKSGVLIALKIAIRCTFATNREMYTWVEY